MKTIIIAEIGECFNGDFYQAEELIKVSAEAGCDYAKFQTLDKDGISNDDPERDWFLKIALSENDLNRLMQCCKKHNIQFLCSPENIKHAKLLKRLGCNEVKITSTCAWDEEMVDYIAQNFSIVFLSTGMASLEDVDELMNKFDKQEKVYLMHCVSEYPTGPLLEQRGLTALKPEDVHLRMMDILMKRYPNAVVGYSDHTSGINAPIAAVARGAKVIEKHITLDRSTPVKNFLEGKEYMGTDHVLSAEPEELKTMVSSIREVENMIGSDSWERSEGEKILMNFLKGRFSN